MALAGPQRFRSAELIRLGLSARHDVREVAADPHARYFGAELGERALLPGDDASLGEMRFDDWLDRVAARPVSPPPPSASADRGADAPSASR